MNSAVVVLACMLVAVSAQQYNRYQAPNKYNSYNPYNQYNQYNRYNQNNYNAYKPFANNKNSFPFPSVVASPVKPAAVPVVSVEVPAPAPVPAVVLSQVAPAPAVVVSQVAPVPRVASDDRSAEILKYGNEINNEGRNYYFESNNGIAVQAQLVPRNFGGNPPVISDVAQGSFSWISPEGKHIAIQYVADENGYQPSGDALPKAPEVPAQIARALAYAAKYSAGIKN